MTRKQTGRRLGTAVFETRGCIETLFGGSAPEEMTQDKSEYKQVVTSFPETTINETSVTSEIADTSGTSIIGELSIIPSTSITSEVKETPKTPIVSRKKKIKSKPVTQIISSVGGNLEFTPTRGLQDGWERHTYVIQTRHVEWLEAAAFWDRKDIKTVLEEALDQYFSKKKIKPLPVEKRRERKPRARKNK